MGTVAEGYAAILKHRKTRAIVVGDRIFDFFGKLLRRAGRNFLEYREIGVFFEQALRHAVIAEYNHLALNGKISGDAEFGESERVCIPMWRSEVWKAQKRASIRNDEEANASSISA